MKNKKVLLGMSGGVDSSVSAVLLQKQGYEVTGCSFLFAKKNDKIEDDFVQVKELADQLDIKHIVIDLTNEFNDIVIQYFLNGYINGFTPFPCAVCNPNVKWKNLLHYADELGCKYIATGHYVKNELYQNRNYVYKGVDQEKDQSFFLWGLNQKVLQRSLFPLGKYLKNEVREIAEKSGFKSLSQKKDSLGICFLQDKNYRNFLSKKVDISPGNFVDSDGNILGKHSGYINYTIGQRRGLGINLNTPVFVSEIRPKNNEIVLSEFESLFRKRIFVSNYHFIHIDEITFDKIWNVKIRYRNQNTPCKIKIIDSENLEIDLLEPLESVAAGQTAVFYDEGRVVGGGFIKSSD